MSNSRKGIRVGLEADRGPKMEIMVNGEAVEAYGGETVATAMLAAGHWTCQTQEQRPMGVFCNIGVCHSCLVTIDGVSGVRACQTTAKPGMVVESRSVEKDRF